MVRFHIWILVLCAVFCVNVHAAPINRVVAVVNGEMITEFDLNRMAAPVLLRAKLDPKREADVAAIDKIRRDVLQSQIQDMIVGQEAERLKVRVDDADIDAAIAALRSESKMTEEQFAKQLEAQKVTMQDFRNQMRKNLLNRNLLGHMVARKVVITKEEIEQYYKDHLDLFSSGSDVHIALLVYPPNAKVEPTATAIKKGKLSFEEAVQRISIGPMKEKGGDVGVLAWNDLSPNLREALSGMRNGDISDPFDLNGLSAQIKLIEAQAGNGETLPLEQVSQQIENTLREPRMHERFKEYMEQLRQRAVVDIRL